MVREYDNKVHVIIYFCQTPAGTMQNIELLGGR